MNELEIRQLEYFLAVNATGSFTRAAERLYVSQPAVTNAIRALEDELGILLFDRKQKSASLTAEGKIFAAHVEQVMQGISQTLEEIDAMKNLASGVLNIGLNPFYALPDFCHVIKNFNNRYPAIKLKLIEVDDENLTKLLVDDKLDFAILCAQNENTAFNMQPLPAQEIVVCSSHKHRLQRKNSITLTDIVSEPLLLPETNNSYTKELLRRLKLAEQELQPIITVSQVHTLKALITANLGITLLPKALCDGNNNITATALKPTVFLEPVLAWKCNRHLSHAAEAFLHCMTEEFGGTHNDKG